MSVEAASNRGSCGSVVLVTEVGASVEVDATANAVTVAVEAKAMEVATTVETAAAA